MFTVDGSLRRIASFELDVQAGDLINLTGGDGSAADEIRTIGLTNASASGTVDLADGTNVSVEGIAD